MEQNRTSQFPKKTIVLVATLDTKGEEAKYLKERIEIGGFNVIVIDVGTGPRASRGSRGTPLFPPDISREQVAKAATVTIEEILTLAKQEGAETRIMELMATGGAKIVQELQRAGKLDGIISLGGSRGTILETMIMKALPLGIPKVMLSTIASGDMRPYIGISDITIIPSVADLIGLNRVTETALTLSAGAVMGMVAIGAVKPRQRPVVAVTNIGGTTACALRAKQLLEDKGYEVIVFHTVGTGGRAMEEMIEQGLILAVFDLSTNELVDNLYGGFADAGPKRLETAGRKGIPQLVAPGNMDHMIFTSSQEKPDRFKHQKAHAHGPGLRILATKKNEMIEVAEVMAAKLNKATGPTAVIFPRRGLSGLALADKEFDNPDANLALLEVLKQKLKPEISIVELDLHINDEAFAEQAATLLCTLMQKGLGTASLR